VIFYSICLGCRWLGGGVFGAGGKGVCYNLTILTSVIHLIFFYLLFP